MDEIKEKLDNFTSAFLTESARSAKKIIQDVENSQDQVISAAKQKIDAEAETYIKKRISEIQNREGSRVSARLLDNKRQLFSLRKTSSEQLFQTVRERIEVFAASDAYGGHLVRLFKKALETLGEKTAVTVELRPEDTQYQDALAQAAGGFSLSFQTGSFSLGGLIVLCPSKILCIDLSFDTALADASNHFVEFSGIDLE